MAILGDIPGLIILTTHINLISVMTGASARSRCRSAVWPICRAKGSKRPKACPTCRAVLVTGHQLYGKASYLPQ